MSLSESLDRLLQQIVTTVIFILFLVMMFKKLAQKDPDEEGEEVTDQVDGGAAQDSTDQAEEEEDEDEDAELAAFEEEEEALHEEEEILPSAPRIIVEEDAQSTTESEILIEDEMHKQLHKCTCQVPLRMHRLGGGKYRISGSRRTCLVRILRSAVMVRVGGGWVTLEEFLIKHDPCRGRAPFTNATASAFAQEMVAFKAKRQPAK